MTSTRDNNGLVLGDGHTTYTYDRLNRLVQESHADDSGGPSTLPAYAYQYSYDAADRLTSQVASGGFSGTVSLTYDAADEVTTYTNSNLGTSSFTYDADGNRTSAGSYDQADRLLNLGAVYNGDGLLQRQSSALLTFVWDVAEGLPLMLDDGNASYVTGPGGLPLEYVYADGTVFYYHHNQVGSTIALTDGTGAVAEHEWYRSAYGDANQQDTGVYDVAEYTGQYYDGGKVTCVQGEAGISVGVAASGCLEQAYLSGNNFQAVPFAAGGAFAGGVANYQNFGWSWPCSGPVTGQHGALGASAGFSAGIFITNESTNTDIEGPFHTLNFAVGPVGVSWQTSVSDPTVWQLNLMFSPVGAGASVSQYDTSTSKPLPRWINVVLDSLP